MKITIEITQETTRSEILQLKTCFEALLNEKQPHPEKKFNAQSDVHISSEMIVDRMTDTGISLKPVTWLPISKAHKVLDITKSVTWIYWKVNKGDFSSKKIIVDGREVLHVSLEELSDYLSK